MRSHREGTDGRGVEHLWAKLCVDGVVANLLIPYSIDHTSLATAPVWTLAGALVILSLSRFPCLR